MLAENGGNIILPNGILIFSEKKVFKTSRYHENSCYWFFGRKKFRGQPKSLLCKLAKVMDFCGKKSSIN